MRLLLDRGINVNATGRRLLSFRKDTGLTPLMYAALNEHNDPTIVHWLLEKGADVNARASSGETALTLAQLRGKTKIVAALLDAGAKSDKAEEPALLAGLWNEAQAAQPTSRIERKAAETAISVLLKSGARLTDATANRCFTCHHQSQPAIVWSVARKTGLDYPEDIVASELKTTIAAARRRTEGAIEGPFPVPNIAGWLLVGLAAAEYPSDTATDYYAYALARYQFGDGRWIAKGSRAPTDYSDVSSTAVAIRALKAYAPPTMRKRFDRSIAKAAGWLSQFKPQSTEERSMQLLGLHWAGSRSELQRLGQELLAQQRSDGGWAQISTLESDAYATGLALYALNQAGGISPSHPAYQNGIKFLLKHQQADGSWRVQTRASPVQVAIDNIFPHGKDQWISSIATGWSAAALALASAESGHPTKRAEAKSGRPAIVTAH